MSADRPRTVAVIPAHDEAATVAQVVAAAARHVSLVIVVDDGSADGTAELAATAGAQVVRLVPNKGKGAALARGLAEAVARDPEAVVTLDADGEHDADEIPALLAALSDADIALGTRDVHRSGVRRALNGFALFWFRLLDPAIRDTICGFRAFRTPALAVARSDASGFAYEHEVLVRAVEAGLRLRSVPVSTHSRERSHVTTREIVRANNHFDRVVLASLRRLPLPAWRKALLLGGCAAGLAAGSVAERALASRAPASRGGR